MRARIKCCVCSFYLFFSVKRGGKGGNSKRWAFITFEICRANNWYARVDDTFNRHHDGTNTKLKYCSVEYILSKSISISIDFFRRRENRLPLSVISSKFRDYTDYFSSRSNLCVVVHTPCTQCGCKYVERMFSSFRIFQQWEIRRWCISIHSASWDKLFSIICMPISTFFDFIFLSTRCYIDFNLQLP